MRRKTVLLSLVLVFALSVAVWFYPEIFDGNTAIVTIAGMLLLKAAFKLIQMHCFFQIEED